MWFELECALSYYRQGKLGEALKKCHQVEKVCWKNLCVVVDSAAPIIGNGDINQFCKYWYR